MGRLADELSYEEFLGWHYYFSKRPPEWRADYRASVVASSFTGKFDSKRVFPSLAMVSGKPKAPDTVTSLRGSMLMTMMRNSVGGEKLPCLWEDWDASPQTKG